jgi:hypothetical protein
MEQVLANRWQPYPWRAWSRDQDGNESKGPNPKQKLAWFENMQKAMREGRLPPGSIHTHNRDIMLAIGGTRSGKSTMAVSRFTSIARRFPGSKLLVGSMNWQKLKETILLDYQELFSKHSAWDHPAVKQSPDDRHKYLLLGNGHGKPDSVILFKNLAEKKGEGILGLGLDAIHIDEPQLLLHFENVLDAGFTRLSNSAVPFKQMIFTANPTSNLAQIKRRFELRQFEEGYMANGGKPIPIGPECECHICTVCRLPKNGGIKRDYDENGKCEHCGNVKKNICIGRQHYYRVVFSSAEDNMDNLPETYQADMETGMGEEASKKFGLGIIMPNKGGVCYGKFKDSINTSETKMELDLIKNIIWTLDLNQRPQSSVIYQKRLIKKKVYIDVIDEIAKFDADIFDVADIFIERYFYLQRDGFEQSIILRGDPMMHTGSYVRDGDEKTKDKFIVLANRLKRAGFRVEIGQPQTRYLIKDRIECANFNFRDDDNEPRIKINQSCQWLIMSAEQTVWNAKGSEESKDKDTECMRKGRDGEVWGTTHHMAALGYSLLIDSPMVAQRKNAPVMVAANGNVITVDSEGKLIERTAFQVESEEEEDDVEIESRDDDYDDPPEVESLPIERSIADSMSGLGLWNLNRPY